MVSGADHMPDWNHPWVMNVLGKDDSNSHEIVLVEDEAFSTRTYSEGSYHIGIMARVVE